MDRDAAGDTPRAQLAAARRHTAERLAAAQEELGDIVTTTRDANSDDEHDPEGATIAFERARVLALLDDAQTQLASIDRALDRLDAGDYGRCAGCGAPIAAERLAALPTTDRCIACAGATGHR